MKNKSKKSEISNINPDDTVQVSVEYGWSSFEVRKNLDKLPISHRRSLDRDSKEFDDDWSFDFVDFDDELKKIKKKDLDDFIKLRSEQIYINEYEFVEGEYNKVFSILCIYSKNIFNSSIYQIKQAMKKNFDYDYKYDDQGNIIEKRKVSNVEKKLRLDIFNILNEKDEDGRILQGYQYKIYGLLDDYFRLEGDENYIAIPQQTSQQAIKMACDALYSNEQSKISFKYHPWDYTGEPGDIGYKKEGKGCINGEGIAILTNQQCHIERKNVRIKGPNEKKICVKKNCLTFPPDLRKSLGLDTLGVNPIPVRLGLGIDLRHVRIVPLKIGYKVEIVYKKVIPGKIEKIIEGFKSMIKKVDRIMGIDIGVNNTMGIGCLEIDPVTNKPIIIGHHPILIIGKYLKSVNQWFNKEVARLYSIYMKQQGFEGSKSKGQTVKMGKKFKILSMNRDNSLKDIFHKLSNLIVKYCWHARIGTIVIDWSKGIKQNMRMGDVGNQNFAYIPFATKLIKMIKYKARLFGIKVVQNNVSKR